MAPLLVLSRGGAGTINTAPEPLLEEEEEEAEEDCIGGTSGEAERVPACDGWWLAPVPAPVPAAAASAVGSSAPAIAGSLCRPASALCLSGSHTLFLSLRNQLETCTRFRPVALESSAFSASLG